jgi:hypothetical protein
MTARTARRALAGLCAAIACGSLVTIGTADGKATNFFPYIGGSWSVTALQCAGTCHDTWFIGPVKANELAPYAYTMHSANGFYFANHKPPTTHADPFTIPPDGKLEIIESCNGCTGYSKLKITFEALPGGIKRFTGKWQPFSPHSNAAGAPLFPGGMGDESGELVKPEEPPARNPGTQGWGPSKCRRAYAAWTKAHPGATGTEMAAETRKLDKAHDCSL